MSLPSGDSPSSRRLSDSRRRWARRSSSSSHSLLNSTAVNPFLPPFTASPSAPSFEGVRFLNPELRSGIPRNGLFVVGLLGTGLGLITASMSASVYRWEAARAWELGRASPTLSTLGRDINQAPPLYRFLASRAPQFRPCVRSLSPRSIRFQYCGDQPSRVPVGRQTNRVQRRARAIRRAGWGEIQDGQRSKRPLSLASALCEESCLLAFSIRHANIVGFLVNTRKQNVYRTSTELTLTWQDRTSP